MTRTYFASSAAFVVVLACGSLAPATSQADTIRLRTGKGITGQFTGASSETVRILLDNGSVTQVPVSDVATIEFTPRPKPAAAAPATARPAVPDPTRAPAPIMVPAGTVVRVRLTQAGEPG